MEWLAIGVPIILGLLLINWLVKHRAQKLETKAARKNEANKLRLEPSAKLPEISAPTARYQTKPTLLSKAEQAFYQALHMGLSDQYLILMKVRVADVLKPQTGISKSEWQSAFSKISCKHFDFLLCSPTSYEIIAAIELDDRSHQLTNRRARDQFLNSACESANFALIRIRARKIYSAQEIKAAVLGSLRDYNLHQAA